MQDSALTTVTLLFDIQASDTTLVKISKVSESEIMKDESISVYNQTKQRFIFSNNKNNPVSHSLFIAGLFTSKSSVFTSKKGYQIMGIKVRHGGDEYWIVTSAYDVTGNQALSDLRKILIVMCLIGILGVSLSGWAFAGNALAPMSAIIQQVNGIFPRNVEKRVLHPNRSDEIGLLVETFNKLLDRVEETLQTQKIFIANVSHELKNPLTKMYSQLDVTLMQPRSLEVYTQSLESLKEDTRTLTQLTNTLLNLANTIVDGQSLPKIPVRMDELLWEAKNQVQKWHQNYQITLHFDDFPDEEEALMVEGNEAALKVLCINLIDNACKFSPNHTVQVYFTTQTPYLELAFFNEGPAIPSKDLPNIFEPFYRSDATAQAVKGHGVGLTIVAKIVEIHQGTIHVASDATGTRFTVGFPTLSILS